MDTTEALMEHFPLMSIFILLINPIHYHIHDKTISCVGLSYTPTDYFKNPLFNWYMKLYKSVLFRPTLRVAIK